eukprot:scaffold75838_cov19-Tisochrysis_lutea.AAC.5
MEGTAVKHAITQCVLYYRFLASEQASSKSLGSTEGGAVKVCFTTAAIKQGVPAFLYPVANVQDRSRCSNVRYGMGVPMLAGDSALRKLVHYKMQSCPLNEDFGHKSQSKAPADCDTEKHWKKVESNGCALNVERHKRSVDCLEAMYGFELQLCGDFQCHVLCLCYCPSYPALAAWSCGGLLDCFPECKQVGA